MSPEIGRLLFAIGLVVAGVGLLLMLGIRLPLGRLPGDIAIGGPNGGIFVPLGTGLVLSIVLTIIVNVVMRR